MNIKSKHEENPVVTMRNLNALLFLILLFSVACVASCSGGSGKESGSKGELPATSGQELDSGSDTTADTDQGSSLDSTLPSQPDTSQPSNGSIDTSQQSQGSSPGSGVINQTAIVYYIDPMGGSEVNNGLSPDSPKQYYPKSPLPTGADVFFKRGTTCTEIIRIRHAGTQSDPVIIGAYGTGPTPVFSLGSRTQGIWVNTKATPYVVIEKLCFTSTEQSISQCAIAVDHARDINIRQCSFDGVNGSSIFLVHSTPCETNDGNIHIADCSFSNTPIYTAIKGFMAADDDSPGSIHDITISRCSFDHVRQALAFFGEGADNGEAYVGSNDYAPYGIIFEDSVVSNTTESALGTYCGIKKVNGHTSYIRRNTFTNIGTPTTPNINGIQVQWARDLIIEDNTITNVYTSACDGAGIIIDYAWRGGATGESYLSNGLIVRRNIVSGCNSCRDCSAIAIPNGTNTKVYNNFCFNNGSGGRVSRPHATGNSFYNNTFVHNESFGMDLSSAPMVVIQNNILAYNQIGLILRARSEVPIENHNCLYGNTVYNIRNYTTSTTPILDTTDIITDPKLDSILSNTSYHISSDSPCKDTGTALTDVTTDIRCIPRPASFSYDIGCYEINTP
jgi:hypothetical protein